MGTNASKMHIVHTSIKTCLTNIATTFINDKESYRVHIKSINCDNKSAFILEKYVNKNNGKDVSYGIIFVSHCGQLTRSVQLLRTKNSQTFRTFFNMDFNWTKKHHGHGTMYELYEVWKKNCLRGQSIILCDSIDSQKELQNIFGTFIANVHQFSGMSLDAELRG